MEYYKKWSEDRWFLFSWRKSWSLKEFSDIGGWHNTGAWIFSIGFDGDDDPGDPSGFHILLCGTELEIYWPMHYGIMVNWSLGSPLKPRVSRFTPQWWEDKREIP